MIEKLEKDEEWGKDWESMREDKKGENEERKMKYIRGRSLRRG